MLKSRHLRGYLGLRQHNVARPRHLHRTAVECGLVPLLFGVGVTTIVTVAVEPACSDGRLQLTTALVRTAAASPGTGAGRNKCQRHTRNRWLRLSSTVMLLATSGPLLVIV